MHWHTALALSDVGADVLSQNIVGANSSLGHEGAGIVTTKDGRFGRR